MSYPEPSIKECLDAYNIPGVHPAANQFPLITGSDFQELCKSIGEHGLEEDIVLTHDGLLLDGRNRLRALLVTGQCERFKFLDQAYAKDYDGFVQRMNKHRRGAGGESMQVRTIPVDQITEHPQNPRIEPRQEIIDQIAGQLANGFDPSHALIVRPHGAGYQVISGHHRLLAAKQSGITEVPCWVKDLSDEQAYMELVLCNTQSELHPLEEGKHAAESGMDLKAYAEAAGKVYTTLSTKVKGWRVMSVTNVSNEYVRDQWLSLATIHATPQWLWSAMVQKMIEGQWTVATTRQMVGNFKGAVEPPEWCDQEKIAINLLSGNLSVSDIGRMEKAAYDARITDKDLGEQMMSEIRKKIPSLLSEVQAIVSKWEREQEDRNLEKQRKLEEAKSQAERLRKIVSLVEWDTLSSETKEQLLNPEKSTATFNKQESKDIEWAQWSWNPITGCKHDCSYCYARDIAQSKRMQNIYLNGFEPSFYSDRLLCPKNTKVPSEAATDTRYKNVFTCSMADLFGRWVPLEWINAVMGAVKGSPEWNYLFLTKFPQRLKEIEVPDNAWMGTTVDLQKRVKNAEKAFENVGGKVKWLSIEPLIEPLKFERLDLFDWVVIGGASASNNTPEWRPPYRWIEDIVRQCDDAKVPIYFKSNLGIANRVLELPFDAPIHKDPQEAPASFKYLGK